MWTNAKKFFLEIFFPAKCFFCGAAGGFLCGDCFELLEISPVRRMRCGSRLDGLYAAASYQNRFVKEMIQAFKYEPFLKDLKVPLAAAVMNHFELLEDKPDFSGFSLAAVPLAKKRLRWRGFNQAEALAGELSKNMGLPLLAGCLERIKETELQANLPAAIRRTNIQGSIACPRPGLVRNKKILLVDDVVTTCATMEECAKVLKQNGAATVIGIAVAGSNGQ